MIDSNDYRYKLYKFLDKVSDEIEFLKQNTRPIDTDTLCHITKIQDFLMESLDALSLKLGEALIDDIDKKTIDRCGASINE